MDATSPGAPGGDADAAPESLRSKLWAAVGQSKAIRTKEMQESCAFYDCVRKDARKLRPEVVVDVCGGHGALALLFLAHGQAQQATIIDPQRPASHATLREAWSSFVTGPISYDQRPLQQALPEVLKGNSKRMLVVACHACQHLAREIIDHCMAHNTAFAVCPCCPKDHQGHLQAAAKSLEVEFPAAMILAEMGRLTAQHCACALRSFDAKVSPHNRVIFGRPGAGPQEASGEAEEKLRRAYARAHHPGSADGRAAGLWSSAEAVATAAAGIDAGPEELKQKEQAVRELLSPVTGQDIWERLEVRESPRRHFRARTVVAVGAPNTANLSPEESGGLFRFVPTSSGYQLQSTIPTETLLPQIAAALPALAQLLSSFSEFLAPRCVKLHGTLGTSQLLCCRAPQPAGRRLEKMHPIPGSLLARAFIQADLESPKVILLLEGLAAVARQQGWTCLSPSGLEQTDFQKQCAETIQDFLPSILVNQRHEMGPLLSLVLPHCDGSHLNLELDPLDLQLSRLDRAVRTRRDEFLEDLGVQVLRLKVRDQDDLRYHLLQIFGHPAKPGMDDIPAEPPASEVGPLDEEAVAMCGHVWNEMESGRVQHESLL